MIFNLNEQKVLSDPSGSSVFKGEKDFNDIVVNLPDNIDGHTATELNYVMHFVDSDGGYSTKILTVDSSGEALKATATVSTNITSKAQAFYAYVLMTDDEETVIGKTNGVIVMIHPVPDEENEIIPPADADKIIKGLEEIVQEATETIETATDTIEEATEAISSKQDKLTAGQNITIDEDNVISAEGGGVTSYEDLTNKPKYNINYDGTFTNKNIIGIIKFLHPFFQDENGITLKNITNQSLQDYTQYFYGFYSRAVTYNFGTTLSHVFVRCGCFSTTVNFCSNIPSAFSPYLPSNDLFYIIHLFTTHGAYNSQLARMVIFEDNTSHKIRVFAQLIGCELSNPEATITAITDWVELTGGGSQIVSGVVNTNGTITFTDSDGNTFTTSGSSVIGPQGDDYVLTQADKAEIAQMAVDLLPNADIVSY